MSKSSGKSDSNSRSINPDNFNDLLDALPDLNYIISSDGLIINGNRKGLTILGIDEYSLGNKYFKEFLPDSIHVQFQENLNQALITNERSNFETNLIQNGGKLLDVELFISQLTTNNDNHAPVCLIVARDISAKKKQELDLLRFTNLAHFTVNPIEITDPFGHIIYVNPAFEKASGYSKEELIGKNPNIFSSHKHPKSFWQKMWQTISSGKVWVGEVENLKRNNEPFYTQILVSPIVNPDGDLVGYFGIHRDISEKKYLEQQLIHAQKMESIGMLAAGLAHEVGNPLASISSLVQIIQRTSEDEFTQDKLELIKSQVTRISRIIRDLVDFSRKSTYELQLTEVNKNIRDAVEIVKVGKKAKDIQVKLDLTDKLPPLSLVPDQIEQVFINLLLNAVDAIQGKFFADGQQKQISVSSYMTEDNIVITINDNGKGIKQDDLTKIFEPFFTTKKVGEGTGLGLWVSYGIIKSFRGEIRVKSTENVGTTFTVHLPVQ
ncbi:MAG: PAS domain S-box protein [Ignavibacteriales bacterium]|nr:PAS domain S-box protein [Ignavibacteriales bacterium]